jgi:hypothetical protein
MARRGGRWWGSVGGRYARALRLAVIALALVPTSRSAATTIESMTTTAQATSADRIFVGTVTAVLSRPKATAPKYFETVVGFDIEETVAGSTPAHVDLTFSGGEVGGILQRVDGMPRFAVGERYVVLLESDQQPPLASPLIGFNQGLYRVIGASRASAVVRDSSGQPLPAAPAGEGVAASARSAGEPSLDAFLDTLRAARGR